jgi:hypothetical protein
MRNKKNHSFYIILPLGWDKIIVPMSERRNETCDIEYVRKEKARGFLYKQKRRKLKGIRK